MTAPLVVAALMALSLFVGAAWGLARGRTQGDLTARRDAEEWERKQRARAVLAYRNGSSASRGTWG